MLYSFWLHRCCKPIIVNLRSLFPSSAGERAGANRHVLLHHPVPEPRIRHEAFLILPEYPVAVARDEIVDGVAERLWHRTQRPHPAPTRQMAQHRQLRVGFETGDAAMDDGVGVGVFRVDAERLCETCAIAGLDRGEAKAPVLVARRDEADPARAEHADAVIEDHIIVGPALHHHRLSSVSSATSIRTMA